MRFDEIRVITLAFLLLPHAVCGAQISHGFSTSPLLPGSKIVAGDLSKNELFILAANDEAIKQPVVAKMPLPVASNEPKHGVTKKSGLRQNERNHQLYAYVDPLKKEAGKHRIPKVRLALLQLKKTPYTAPLKQEIIPAHYKMNRNNRRLPACLARDNHKRCLKFKKELINKRQRHRLALNKRMGSHRLAAISPNQGTIQK